MKANHTQVDNELDLFNMMQDADNKSDSEDNHAKMVNYRSNTTFDEEKLGQQEDVQLVEKEIADDATSETAPKAEEKTLILMIIQLGILKDLLIHRNFYMELI